MLRSDKEIRVHQMVNFGKQSPSVFILVCLVFFLYNCVYLIDWYLFNFLIAFVLSLQSITYWNNITEIGHSNKFCV